MRDIVSPLDGIRSPFGQRRTFSPSSLFANGEQGLYWDISDFSTMFQDSAGTTPVTAVEQPVGLILDKSKGLVLGAERFAETGPFTSATGWSSFNGGSVALSGSSIRITGAAADSTGAYYAFATTAGKNYKYRYTRRLGTATVVDALFSASDTGGGASLTGLSGTSYNYIVANGTGEGFFTATDAITTFNFQPRGVGLTAFIDTITVYELPGNHASQSTSASRPVLSARVNLLTYSEQFDNAAWSKASCAVAQNSVAAPGGATTADTITAAAATAAHYVSQTITWPATIIVVSVYVKRGTQQYFQITSWDGTTSRYANFDILNGTTGTTSNSSSTITDEGGGWYLCKMTSSTAHAAATGNVTYAFANSSSASANVSYATSGTETFYLWGADARPANDGVGLPAYQRIAAATGYDTTGFPYYLRHDGTDDSVATSAIDFSGTDKMAVVAGLRKLSDAAQGIVVELTAATGSNNGAFHISAPTGAFANYRFTSKGTTQVDNPVTTYTSPITNVITGLGNISAPSNMIRVNGAEAGSVLTTQGTGNYANAVLYIGRRGGSTLPFNGRIYGLVIVGRALTATEITNVETWMNSKTGAY